MEKLEDLFNQYSGPFRRDIDSIVRISDSLIEFRCTIDLAMFDISLCRIIRLDRHGRRQVFVDPLYFLQRKDDPKQAPKKVLHLGQVEKLIELLETGKLEPDDVFLFGMDYEEAQADEGEEDPGEDQSGDAGGEQSDAPSEPGEDQP